MKDRVIERADRGSESLVCFIHLFFSSQSDTKTWFRSNSRCQDSLQIQSDV